MLAPFLYEQIHALIPGTANDVHLVSCRAEQIRHEVLELATTHGTALGPRFLECSGEGILRFTLSFAVLAQKSLPHYEAQETEECC